MKVKLLQHIKPHRKGEVLDMRDDLVNWIFKSKVQVLDESKTEKEAKKPKQNKSMAKKPKQNKSV